MVLSCAAGPLPLRGELLFEMSTMPAESNHPVFEAPADPNVKIWRYSDFSKYVSFLEKSALFFPRADLLGDPYEGATSHANRPLWPIVYKDTIPLSILESRTFHGRWEREWTFINCWHMNEHESDAMWHLYARTCDAVAIQSTYARLHRVLPSGTFVGIVKYMDYKTEWMPEDNGFYRFMRKRKSFEHERELRALIQDLPTKPDPRGSAIGVFNYVPNPNTGRVVPVKVPELVEKVYVAPAAPAWFHHLVTSITAKYALDVPVEQSALDQIPEF
jgi:hypothetical protein